MEIIIIEYWGLIKNTNIICNIYFLNRIARWFTWSLAPTYSNELFGTFEVYTINKTNDNWTNTYK
ncbi:hypothetical protein DFA_06828 [Cavenderia fasciculata]|uniref:Uncharacterized protein n=1 Tax=Cavenderia fasciculata TaxID=261658 RepID=F4Q2E1_CACFS|nr:uncharacterized protein DFA_06828 [Cavenderia fasciculata]EGG18161.1 hypothetical protein DFA_06828 [Cavenderia fasciculata]|eukprot:XP_004366202.1 hypothetical protein DFA_06828 [Cavenderia fasciculata]